MLKVTCRFFRNVFKGRKTPWSQKDFEETQSIHNEVMLNRTYQKFVHMWKHPLELKKLYRERRETREAQISPAPEEPPKLVVHSFAPVESIPLPRQDQIFAVLRINGFQYKVTQDDLLVTHRLPYDIGVKVEFDSVLLVGTPMYTLIGRPVVATAKVIASVEENTLSEKALVFKMRRRKGYKRFYGHRVETTVLRIEEIQHEVQDNNARLFLKVAGYC